MAEFDFDELDKAVTSLMQKQTTASDSTSAAPTTPAEPTERPSMASTAPAETSTAPLPEAGTAATATSPAVPPTAPAASDSATPTEPQPSLATKRRGKFMDVVPPSATVAATPAPKRSGPTLSPINDTATTAASTSPIAPRAVDGISQPPVTAPTRPSNPTSTRPSSPIAERETALNRQPSDADDVTTGQAAPSATESAPTEETASSFDGSATMSSPFLPDAKVDKRPLGVISNDSAETPSVDEPAGPSSEVASPTATSADAMLLDDEPDSSTVSTNELPDELRQDVLSLDREGAVGASTDSAVVATESATQATTPAAPTSAPTEQSVTTAAKEAVTATPPPSPATTTPLVSALPPRQAAPAATDDADSEPAKSIFDSDEHAPLKHQPKRSTGWLTVVIIGTIIVVGAAGGVIVYLLTNGY